MLEAHNVSFAYPKGPVILEDISLEVAPRQRLYVQAPSGTGKTTLCRILAGFQRPSSGEVLVDGQPLSKRGPCPVQLIGQHPEHALDPRMRMKDSLLEAGSLDEGLLQRLGIQQRWLSRFPHELSGGELQRFCIARALAARPRYLIADEISTMLDAVTQARLWQALLAEADARDLGMVFVSHSPALSARIATRVVDLSGDRCGAPDAIRG